MKIFKLFGAVALVWCAVGFVSCEKSSNGGHPTEEPAAFVFENQRSSYTSFKLDILPQDKSSEYIVFLTDKEYLIKSNIRTPEALIEDDVIYFRQYAEAAELGLREFLYAAGWLVSGDKIGYSAVNLDPGTDYIVYCYGVEFDGDYYTVTTDVCYAEVSTTAPAMLDVDFDVKCSVHGNVVEVDVEPQNGYDGLYYIYIAGGADVGYVPQGIELNDERVSAIRRYHYNLFQKYIDEDGISKERFCSHGPTHIERTMNANSHYMITVFALSDDMIPILCSQPVVEYVYTDDVELADPFVEIEITDITPYTAQLSITTTSSESYAAILLSGESLDSMPTDELTLMYAFIEYFDPPILTDVHSEMLTPLMPNTEYAVVAFGCRESHPTTHIVIERFTSAEAVKGSNFIEDIVIRKVWDVNEIVALDSSYAPLAEKCQCLVLVEALTSENTGPTYYWWYEAYARDEYEDEAFLEDLLLYGSTPSPEIMGLWYDFEIFFAGLAEDGDGNLSDIYYGELFTLSEADCSDAQEYLDMVNYGIAPTRRSLCVNY